MHFRFTTSRRALVSLVAVVGISLVGGFPAAAAKKAPNIEGPWTGAIFGEGVDSTQFTLGIENQKKNGKFTGQAQFEGFKPIPISGKIQPNRQLKFKFNGEVNGELCVFSLKLKLERDAQSGSGTFTATNAAGNVVLSGESSLERAPDDV